MSDVNPKPVYRSPVRAAWGTRATLGQHCPQLWNSPLQTLSMRAWLAKHGLPHRHALAHDAARWCKGLPQAAIQGPCSLLPHRRQAKGRPLTMRLSMKGLFGSLSSSFWYRLRASVGLFISSKYMPCGERAFRLERN